VISGQQLALMVGVENERFPIELGWTRVAEEVSLTDITRLSEIFANASTLLTGLNTTTSARRRDLHSL
jgi:hypothetical protein